MNIDLLKEIDRQIQIAIGMLIVGHTHEAKIQLATIHVGLSIVINACDREPVPTEEMDLILQEMTRQATEDCRHGGTT